MSDGVRRSLWAVPSAASSVGIRELASRAVASAGSTPFDLHVTLLGDIDAEDLSDAVAALLEAWRPFRVTFDEVDDEDEVFRCLRLRTSSVDLLRLREALGGVVHDASSRPYRPHLSLLYGAFDAAERRRIVQACAPPSPLPSIDVDAVELWDTSSDDWAQWHRLERWSLSAHA